MVIHYLPAHVGYMLRERAHIYHGAGTGFLSIKMDQNWLIEQFHVIMQRLLDVHTNTYREVEAIPAMRAATREEQYLFTWMAFFRDSEHNLLGIMSEVQHT